MKVALRILLTARSSQLRFKRCGIPSFPFHSLSSPNLLILDLSFNALKGQVRIDGWGETLTTLHLQGNQVTCVTVASGMGNLNDLDVSSNALTDLEGLDVHCANLMKVNFSRNRWVCKSCGEFAVRMSNLATLIAGTCHPYHI